MENTAINKYISKLFFCIGTASMMLALALALGGCGSSGGTSGTASGSTPGVSIGTVAKSVSSPSGQQITVNNVIFTTAQSSITVNGDPAAAAVVKPGMQATITGSVDGMNGSAVTVEVEGELEGMVEQINSGAGSMVVLGQTVLVNAQTVFEGTSGLSLLSVGQMVEVHGFPDATGVIEATRVEVKMSSRPNYVTGPISNLDTVAKTFTIRTISVDYSGARLPLQTLSNGQTVKVKGAYTNGVLTATSIRAHHVHLDHGHAELEGLVTDYDAAAGTFTLHGQPVQLTSTTSYSHGAASEIANGVKVEVKGDVIDGVFVARKIDVEGDHGLPVHPPITPVTPPTPVTLPGRAAYDANCAGCHILGNYDISGFAPNLSGKGSLVSDKIVVGHKGISLSSQLLTALAAFVNAN
ncbi:MAG TPA: cytochrome c [Desulfuromonadales bacterium]|nr:cytochrome c [Desulfuromonadales bacterium]